MSSLVYNIGNADFRDKMAAFDYDWTLVHPLGGRTFPINIEDWKWYSPSVPSILQEYYDQGYMIVIFTNQSKQWKCDQIDLVCKGLGIPLFVCIARDKKDYKPSLTMMNQLCKHTIKKDESFFVGDALGRDGDFSDSDKLFAERIGIQWFPPEKVFSQKETIKIPQLILGDSPEIIIMVGYPGSGKTTIANHLCKDDNYIHISGDNYKGNLNKMIQASLEHIQQKKSIVYDATHSSIQKRSKYVDLAKEHKYGVRCIHVSTPLDTSYKRNMVRDDKKKVPKIAYSVYKKHYEEPSEKEGFHLQTI